MEYKPKDIAKQLDVGTSAMRHYEEWGIVPPPKRKPNGYRVYTEEHLAYFQCIRALYPGFGMAAVRKIMPMIQASQFKEALWEINKLQAELYDRKQQALQSLELLQPDQMEHFLNRQKKKWYSIGEVEREIDVPATTIRHWETEGLITPKRNPENGYRQYDREDIRHLLIIRTVQSSVFLLKTVREVLEEMGQHNIAKAREVTLYALSDMDIQIEHQLNGMYYLHNLISMLREKEIQRS